MEYYHKYWSILKRVIFAAVKLYYDKRTELSSNRVKTTWKIIKDTTGKTQLSDTNIEINSGASLLTNVNEIANTLNSYFVNIADDLNNKFIDIGKAVQALKKFYPKNTAEMKIIPITEIEMIDIIRIP
jgi:hypothetical protein